MGKLINRIPVYQVYQAQLREFILNRLAEPLDSTTSLKALPGKLDIKRNSPSMLNVLINDVFEIQPMSTSTCTHKKSYPI